MIYCAWESCSVLFSSDSFSRPILFTNYILLLFKPERFNREISRGCLALLIRGDWEKFKNKNKGKNPISGHLGHRPKARGYINVRNLYAGWNISAELRVITFFSSVQRLQVLYSLGEISNRAAESGPVHYLIWSVPLGICNENIQQVRWKETPFIIPQRISKNISFRHS